MQLYALKDQKLIRAEEAHSKQNYTCPLCKNPIRLRAGRFRIRHFYHYNTRRKCIQARRGQLHLAIQLLLLRMLPENQTRLETPFPLIGRVADLVWEEQKIIFEIQCSRITLTEVKKRELDYASVGYDVIWILSDKIFNKHAVTPAEKYIRSHGGYFALKTGSMIYDQYEIITSNRRRFATDRSMIHPTCPRLNLHPFSSTAPKCLYERKIYAKYYFKGDLIDRALRSPDYLTRLKALDDCAKESPITLWEILWYHIKLRWENYLESLYRQDDSSRLF